MMEASEADLEFENGTFTVRGSPDRQTPLAAVAFAAFTAHDLPDGMEPNLEAQVTFDPPNFSWPFGSHICVVEVDEETGKVDVVKYVAVDDCGNQLNPMIVEGQVHGGVVQGLAQALYEEAVYDEDGNLRTSSLAEYLVPAACDVPSITTDHTVTPEPHQPTRGEGHRRGGRDRQHAGGDERRLRRTVPSGRHRRTNAGVTDDRLDRDPGRQGPNVGIRSLDPWRCRVIPAAFDYERAESADHAVALLTEHGDEAKLIAGGHSLLPLMKLRLAQPSMLIDIGRLTDLSYVRDQGDHLAIGALTRHRDLETSSLLQAEAPLMAHVAGQVGDPQVRHRGTIGGSIAHADPASDLPAVVLALGGDMVIRGADGERVVPARDFYTGFLECQVGPDELLTEVRVPKVASAGWSFQKFNRRAQDWAIVGVAAVKANGSSGVALVNMGSTPVYAGGVVDALAGGASTEEAAEHAADGTEPPSDINASAEFREHLARVLVRRALEEAGD